MTKLTALDLYILTDTLLHSLQFGNWTGSATEEARNGVLKKLQCIMKSQKREKPLGHRDGSLVQGA